MQGAVLFAASFSILHQIVLQNVGLFLPNVHVWHEAAEMIHVLQFPVWVNGGDCVKLLLTLCSVKFMEKIRYVHTLEELSQIIPMEHVQIPECVLQ